MLALGLTLQAWAIAFVIFGFLILGHPRLVRVYDELYTGAGHGEINRLWYYLLLLVVPWLVGRSSVTRFEWMQALYNWGFILIGFSVLLFACLRVTNLLMETV